MTIKYDDWIEYRITNDFSMVDFHAQKRITQMYEGEANEQSTVYTDPEKRLKKFKIDGYMQMGGEYAGNVHVLGSVNGPQKFDENRAYMNANPKTDDLGSDIIGYQIDVKTSAMRGTQDFMDYCLPVPEKDRYKPKGKHKGLPEIAFVLGLVKQGNLHVANKLFIVYLIGWAWDHDLPKFVMADGIFKEKYIIDVPCLRPMSELENHYDKLLIKETL